MKLIKILTFPFWIMPLAVWELCKEEKQITFAVNPGWHTVEGNYHHYNGFYLNGKRLSPKEMYDYEKNLITQPNNQ